MHEMTVTKSILETVLEYAQFNGASRVTSVTLRIGVLRDFVEEFVQSYFSYLSPGTIAEGAEVIVRYVPIVVECSSCEHEFRIDKDELATYACPKCGHRIGNLVAGREAMIESIEVV